MSINRQITSPIMRSMMSSIIAGAKRWFSIFGGNNSVLLGVAISPDAQSFSVSLKVRFVAADIGTNTTLLAYSGSVEPRIVKRSTQNTLRIVYPLSGGGSGTLNSSVVFVADKDYVCKFVATGAGTEIFIGGAPVGDNADIVDFAAFFIDLFGEDSSGGNHLNGVIYDIDLFGKSIYPIDEAEGSGLHVIDHLADLTQPLITFPRSSWLKGNRVDIYGITAAISLTGDDFRIKVSGGKSAGSDFPTLISDDDSDFIVYYAETGGNVVLRTSGNNFDTFGVPDNDIFEIQIDYIGGRITGFLDGVQGFSVIRPLADGVDLTTTLARGNLSQLFAAPFGNYSIENITTGDTYEYLCNKLIENENGTCTVPNTGNTGSGFDMTVFNCDASDVERVAAPSDGLFSQTPPRELL